MYLTNKQISIMYAIMKGNPDGTYCDIDQVLERLPYETTKASLQFSIRALISKEMIRKSGMDRRRKRRRILLAPTPEAFDMMRLENLWPPSQDSYTSLESRVKSEKETTPESS